MGVSDSIRDRQVNSGRFLLPRTCQGRTPGLRSELLSRRERTPIAVRGHERTRVTSELVLGPSSRERTRAEPTRHLRRPPAASRANSRSRVTSELVDMSELMAGSPTASELAPSLLTSAAASRAYVADSDRTRCRNPTPKPPHPAGKRANGRTAIRIRRPSLQRRPQVRAR